MVESLQALRQEARELGLVPTEEAVGMAAAIGDAIDKIKSVLSATVFDVGAALAPMLLPALEAVKNIAGWFNRWAKENGAIIRTVAMIGAGLVAAGAIVTGIGAAIFGLGTVFGLLASAVTALGAALGFLLSPVGLVIAAIVGGTVAWAKFTESGRQSMAFLGQLFGELSGIARETFGGIADTIAAGNLQLAAEVAWAGIKLVWHRGTQDINRLWEDAKWWFLAVWTEAKTGLAKVFVSLWADIQRGWAETVAVLQSTWNSFSTTLANGWQSAQQTAGNLLIDAAEASGAVSKEFADAWRDSLNVPIDSAIQQRTEAANNRQAEIDQQRRAALDRIEAEEQGARGTLDWGSASILPLSVFVSRS
jgi:hypothetical protein